MTLGYGSSNETAANDQSSTTTNQQMTTYLPSLPNDSDGASSNINDSQIDCENRLLAWQSY